MKKLNHKSAMATSEIALERLMEGNKRFVESKMNPSERMDECRLRLLGGQNPFAVILGCSDSRVPPELIFDQGPGELFVVRVAGNIAGRMVMGSIEYAVEHLRIPLILVLGHTDCGAVTATAAGNPLPGELPVLAAAIQPALDEARALQGDLIENTAKINAKLVSEKISRTGPIISSAVRSGTLKVMPAFYRLDTGEVDLLENSC